MRDRLQLVIAETVALLCAAASLWPVYDTRAWLLPVFFTVVLVTGSAELLRRVGVPRVLVPLGSLTVLVVWLVAYRVPQSAPLGLVPSPGALQALRDILQSGVRDVDNYAAPVPLTPGFGLLAVGGLGLVAVAIDLVTVQMRRPAAAGLLLLAVYAVPGAIASSGVPWWAFLLGAASYLGLLLAESRERVGRWGRLLGGARTQTASPISVVGRRVGGTALALAVVAPVAVPGLDGHALRFGGSANGAANGHVGTGDPLVNLSRDLGARQKIKVFTVSLARPPSAAAFVDLGAPPYMRTEVFSNFTGTAWQHDKLATPDIVSRDGALTPGWDSAVGVDRTLHVTTTKAFRSRYLPLPYAPKVISGLKGTWVGDGQSLEVTGQGQQTTADMSYDVSQVEPDPQAADLLTARVGDPGQQYLSAPGLANKGYIERALTEAVGAPAARDTHPYALALELQDWFRKRGGFRYDTKAPAGPNQQALLQNFLADRSGFCVHYASAMVLLARVLGIPARLAIGYLPGDGTTGNNNTTVYDITTLYAHAWPELYFDGFGWLRFEPTPRRDVTVDPPGYATAVNAAEVEAEAKAASAAPTTSSKASTASASAHDRDPGVASAAATGGGSGTPLDSRVPAWTGLVALAVLVLGLGPALLRRRVRGRRLASGATPAGVMAAWDEVSDTALDLGLGRRSASQTPRQYAAHLARASGLPLTEVGPLARLLGAYERARFAGRGVAMQDVAADARAVSRALVEGAQTTDRFRARWVPRSTWSTIRAAIAGTWASAAGTLSDSVARARASSRPVLRLRG